MDKEMKNVFIFIGLCFIIYFIFRFFNISREGLTSDSTSTSASSSTTTTTTGSSNNGIAGNAAAYGATIKDNVIKMQDTFLISKYRKDYENAIINLDDLLNNLMLQTALTLDKEKPDGSIDRLAKMQQAKVALNSVMKYIDSQ